MLYNNTHNKNNSFDEVYGSLFYILLVMKGCSYLLPLLCVNIMVLLNGFAFVVPMVCSAI